MFVSEGGGGGGCVCVGLPAEVSGEEEEEEEVVMLAHLLEGRWGRGLVVGFMHVKKASPVRV